ncbi:hypothetical protein JCGZ_20200 [Jatropha curcas]|uniref:Uncharacterized protein n=1 Tax=Jatropha curcas TaxID=180498 RepID=A0A067JTT1_JATCU|nr:hypothetical protein JCGZ_20200 [Jatropha curcas]
MPKVKTNRVKYPEGWELIEPTPRVLPAKMREDKVDQLSGEASVEWEMTVVRLAFPCYVFELCKPDSGMSSIVWTAENDPHNGKRKFEALRPIFKIAHQKSHCIFDLYHQRKEISKELYEFCLEQGYTDRNFVAKWKKPGYERLCCLSCMQPRDHKFTTSQRHVFAGCLRT